MKSKVTQQVSDRERFLLFPWLQIPRFLHCDPSAFAFPNGSSEQSQRRKRGPYPSLSHLGGPGVLSITNAGDPPYPVTSHLGLEEEKAFHVGRVPPLPPVLTLVRVAIGRVSRETCFGFVGNCKGQDRNQKGAIELRCVVAPGITAVFQVYSGSH